MLSERFWSQVEKHPGDGCFIWVGYRNVGGYGQHYRGPGSGTRMAHRLAYVSAKGPIPDGMELDHLCRNRACVRPDHLEPVTTRENVLRGQGLAAQNARRDHCANGHPFTPDNTHMQKRQGGRPYRRCKECVRTEGRERARRKRAAA